MAVIYGLIAILCTENRSENGGSKPPPGTMKEYFIDVKEVWSQRFAVKANSEYEAMKKIEEGEGLYIDDAFEYDYTLDSSEWITHEVIEEVDNG